MIQTGFETRVKVQQIIENQLPEFILDENPNAVEFLKQYYISQEYQSGPVDISENLDQYLKLDNLTPEIVVDSTSLANSINSTDETINVTSTKGYPQKYGLFKIDDEIISYTGITTNSFTGCIRGFSAVTSYHNISNQEELVFSTSDTASHSSGATVQNLSVLFLKEFYKKIKYSLTPGLEDVDFVSDLNVGNFIKEARSFYQSKGTDESFRILFNVLYGVTPKVVNLENLLIKPSAAEYVRREIVVAEAISGNPTKLVGQTIRKSSDTNTYASVSEVESFTKNNKTYYQISLFIGYDESSDIQGTFSVQGKSLVVENVSIGSSIITVDSTIGFAQTGNLISGNNIITYTDKSINQFFGCSGIDNAISVADQIRTDEVVYGYEDGDLTKKVELRFTGVLSQFIPLSETFTVEEGEELYVKNLGEIINNPETNKTHKEIFANSWIYNTSSRYQIDSIFGSSLTLLSSIDKSSLKVGDKVEILLRDTQIVVSSSTTTAFIQSINYTTNQVNLSNLVDFVYNPNLEYDVRRKINKAISSGASLQFGDNALTSDIQNVYNEDDEYMYVASNSLPSYTITKNLFQVSISEATPPRIQGYDNLTQKYSIISFGSNVPFITGDEVYYFPESVEIPGISEGTYYVEVISSNQIRLYLSRSFIGSSYDSSSTFRPYVQFDSLDSNSGSHYFILSSQKSGLISPSKILKKFPISPNIEKGDGELTQPGSVGMLINGVEIINYKSDDKIYYGPLDSVRILNGGDDYDVINLPQISITSDNGSGAEVQPIIRGSVKKIFVDPQDFDINSVVSIALTGGNGSGASFEPVIVKRVRELTFDGRSITDYGGIDIYNETISFTTNHNLRSGDILTYYSNGNLPIGIGTYQGSNNDSGNTLSEGSTYYCNVINSQTIQLYENISDYNSGINTVGFTTINASGIHKFRTEYNKSTLKEIKIINPGSGYENRKLIVKSLGISTTSNTINFANHGFNDGDLIVYNYQNQIISGLSTNVQYRVLKVTDDSFRLCDAGIAGTITSYYQRQDYVKLNSSGSGYQYFSYPPISLSVKYTAVGVGTTTQTIGIITSTPVIRGEIVGTYLYETGSNYGSTILNHHKKPSISIKNGKNAQISPIIVDGAIQSIFVQYGGSEYYSIPDLIVNGEGTGASLRPIVINGRIDNVIVVNPGVGYAQSTTSISVVPAGSNALFDSSIRSLTVNKNIKYGDEVISELRDNLEYSVSGYSSVIKTSFNDNNPNAHSPLIGWAYDGNPIYGPYGYSNTQDSNSPTKTLLSGYTLNTSNIINRPSGFNSGFFVEDYTYTNSGDLDENNGRYCKTPEFENGVYAYFATVNAANNTITEFPYFIGNTYRSNYIEDNSNIDQEFDFNNSNLIRNTLPYKVNDNYAGNDFIIESNELVVQKSIVESVSKASIETFDIIDGGSNYKVNDILQFDNTNTGGGGINAIVSSINGDSITSIDTNIESYQNSIFTWKDGNTVEVSVLPKHSLNDGDSVVISGLTSSLSQINKLVQIGVTSYFSTISQDIPSNAVSGIVTDIYVTQIPENVSIGSSVMIESEILTLLNVFPYNKIIRVKRGVGSAHTSTTTINFIPDKFTFKAKTNYFESKVNDKVFFNPSESIGLGRSVGVSTSTIFALGISTSVGVATYVRNILTQSIYIENHPFVDNQEVILRIPNSSYPISISTTTSGAAFNLPSSGDYQTVYVTNKSKNTIGIKTTLSSSEVFFVGIGSNSYEYSFESNFNQVKAKAQKIISTISVSTAHNLSSGDIVTLTVNPNQSVGVGTSNSIYVKYDTSRQQLLVNPLGFSSSGINTSTNIITISNHNLNTGDKVFYSATDLIASGLSTGSYFVYKVDDDNIKLTSTYIDSKNDPPTVVSIASSGGNIQSVSSINPEIKVVKNNNLVFNLSDSSLSGYNLKIFYDNQFNNEFISAGSTSLFSIIGVGTVGVSTNASLTLNYSNGFPQTLFYALEKSGYISTSDTDVPNYSKISFIDSFYNGSYHISGLGSTTFNISLTQNPEKYTYSQSDCDTLKYTTTSSTAKGGINKIKLLSGGNNYKKVPSFTGVASSEGTGSYVVAKSDNIGKIKEVRILNPGFEYSSDKTLNPTAYISPLITIKSSYNISSVEVVDGGKNYNFAPNLTIINSNTRENIDNGSLEAVLTNRTITSVNVIVSPSGIPADDVEIIATNNSNGTSIDTIYTTGVGVVTCYLTTPILGFSTSPFSVGDKIYVEGIENVTSGTGYNSEDYGYSFFTVTKFENTIPAKLEYNLQGLTTSAGIAKTTQNSLSTIIKSTDFPQFNAVKSFSDFQVGEKISSYDGTKFVERDLIISSYNKSTIKVFGYYDLSVNEVIKGSQSGAIASISEIKYNSGKFSIDYSLRRDFGWNTDTGKLDEDYQVIEDNDYYQNLSYTIQSPIDYETLVSPVNRLLHTSGLKNFADTGITSTSNSGIKTSIDGTIQTLNFINENRIDTINNFDLCIDTDSSSNKTKYIKFQNKKLSDYIECRTNRVLLIDDISTEFSDVGLDSSDQNNLINILPNDGYNRYLVQINDVEKTQYQINELIILNNGDNVYTLEKGFISNSNPNSSQQSERIAEISGYTDNQNNQFLQFNPTDPYSKDYNIKILNNKFINDLSGIGTQNLGLIDLISSNILVSSGLTTSVISVASNSYNSLYFNLYVKDNSTYESNYVEIYLDHNGTDTYLSEYYFNSDSGNNLSYGMIGSFGATISGGILSLDFTNTSTNQISVRSKVVGFGSTSAGIGTYRYKTLGQIDGNELTAVYESKYSQTTGISTIISLDKNTFSTLKSVVRVSVGSTSALHQVLLVNDGSNLGVSQYQFLSIGSTSGIGTFGGEYSGSNFALKFYPDPQITGIVNISSYNEELYTNYDTVNVPEDLNYGKINESLNVIEYGGVNGTRVIRTSFDLNYNGYPIFKKTFNPTDTTVLNPVTGIFTIKNHFFNTGEELTYTPKSTFTGIGQSAIGIGSTADYAGIVTNRLPSKVYPIKITNDTFRLSTREDYASAGIYVTFTSYGLGNAHELEMTKKLEKSLITIDNLVQYPIAYTTLNYTLTNNGGQIGASSTIFSISGISSIKSNDILKIDEEYMQVTNVGFGTTNIGPITGVGTTGLVQVSRGFVGSISTTHTDSSSVKIYRGSYNISGNKIYFTSPPNGDLRSARDSSNLSLEKSSFDGRVYLQKNYASNKIYDDISSKFTGIGRTYTLTINGINTVGLGTSGGNGVVFINSIFQKPSTSNNSGNNFAIIENVGVSSIVFTGISSGSSTIISNDDVNQNQVPRGGLIVSLGSTGGLGYAPLVGASVTAVIGVGGSIVSVGLGTTDILGSGYYGSVSIGVTDPTGINASINATVGAGGTLSFTILNGGSGYTKPTIKIPSPSYENLSLVGVSRLGIGSTTTTGVGLLVNIEVGASSTTGIGSTLFEVTSFEIQRSGYGYQPGDVITPVGLVTAKGLSSPISQFKLNVLDTFTDSFASWQFGELDYIDNIVNLQDGVRTTFPLYYNSSLLSFEIDRNDADSSEIDLNNVLIIFINGVLQKPGDSYTFDGGSSFRFSYPPNPEDQIAIFFYRGSRNVDSILVKNESETIKSGDIIQLKKNNAIPSTINQDLRTVSNIITSDKIETNLYTNQGIDNDNYKPLSWTKQKIDQKINGELVYKTRDSIESEVYPTAKIIGDFSTADDEIFIDDSAFFIYEESKLPGSIDTFNALIVSGLPDTVSAGVTAIVSQSQNQIQYLSIGSSGSYYTTSNITNLHLRSEDFSTGWTSTNSSLTANSTISPDGALTAGKFVCSDTSTLTRRLYASSNITTVSGTEYTYSIYLKSVSNWRYAYISLSSGTTVTESGGARFDIIDGTISQTYSGSSAIDNAGNGWWRVSVTTSGNTITTMRPKVILVDATGTASSSAAGVVDDGLYVWGSQLEAKTSSSAYIPTITSSVSGSSISININPPNISGIGVGITATAIGSIVNGSLSKAILTNPGFGYTTSNSARVLVSLPSPNYEQISGISDLNVEGFSGIITGIGTTTGTSGNPLAIKFHLNVESPTSFPSGLTTDYPIYIYNTCIGNGVTSIDSSNTSIVGVGTTFLDNIYKIHSFTYTSSTNAYIICNILSTTSVVGINTSGTVQVGSFSWGKLSGFNRSTSPISIGVTGNLVDAGLSTFPTIQRRGYGLRDTGSLKKDF